MVISSSKSSGLVRNNGDVSNENGDGYLEACLQKYWMKSPKFHTF
jgi:hypothetical protein